MEFINLFSRKNNLFKLIDLATWGGSQILFMLTCARTCVIYYYILYSIIYYIIYYILYYTLLLYIIIYYTHAHARDNYFNSDGFKCADPITYPLE